MKNIFLFFILLVAIVSVFLVVRFTRENADVTKILDQERYSRLLAEEELQKSEYRIKKLEADLQTTQVKVSRVQEHLDKERDTSTHLKAQLAKLGQTKANLEKDLQSAVSKSAVIEQAKNDAEARLQKEAAALVVDQSVEPVVVPGGH